MTPYSSVSDVIPILSTKTLTLY